MPSEKHAVISKPDIILFGIEFFICLCLFVLAIFSPMIFDKTAETTETVSAETLPTPTPLFP